jgi:hypothetical protein
LLDNYSLCPQICHSLVYFLLKNNKYLEINIYTAAALLPRFLPCPFHMAG